MVEIRKRDRRSRSRSPSPDGNRRKHGRKEETEEEKLSKAGRTIFVGQLTSKVNEDKLESFFNQVGVVNEVIMVRDKRTNKHKGFAYVEMSTLEAIPNCLLFNKSVPDFQKFEILVSATEESKPQTSAAKVAAPPAVNPHAPAPPPPPRGRVFAPVGQQLKSRIYIGNICSSADTTSFTNVLGFYGALETIQYHQVKTNIQKKYAFAKFISNESALATIEALNGFVLGGSSLVVADASSIADDKADNEVIQKYQGIKGDISQFLSCSLLFDGVKSEEMSWTEHIEEDFMEEFSNTSNENMKIVTCKVVGNTILVEFVSNEAAKEAAHSKLNGRFYARGKMECRFISQSEFTAN